MEIETFLFLLPAFFLHLYSYNTNTVTRVEIEDNLCGHRIILFNNMTILFCHLLLFHFSETGTHVFHFFNKGN